MPTRDELKALIDQLPAARLEMVRTMAEALARQSKLGFRGFSQKHPFSKM
jgi:hypothetical protein